MNWLEKMKKLQAENKSLLATAKAENRALSEDESSKFEAALKEIDNCQKMMDYEKSVENVDSDLKNPVVVSNENKLVPAINSKKEERVYKNFSEQLLDIKNAAITGQPSEKLLKVHNAASGNNEGIGSDGGYAVQSDFAGMMLETAVRDDGILSRVDSFQISGNANRVNWTDIDESDVSTTVFGGIQTYWLAEAEAVTASKPKLKEGELKLEKIMGLAYATAELDADSSFINDLYTRGFTTAIRRMLTDAIVAGDGVGKPTGILTGGGLVTVAKESGQAADTIVWDNVKKMYHRAIDPRNGGYAWIVHPDAHEQLESMSVVVGTGGVPVYQPASMTGSIDMLRGLPVLTSDHCSALGDKGDIILADLSDYFLPFKGQIQQDVSIHVQFLQAENAYRFIYRVNGRPKTLNQLTIKNSSKKRGKYITLAARA